MVRHDVFYVFKWFEAHTQIEEEDGNKASELLMKFVAWLEKEGATTRVAKETPKEAAPTGDPVCPIHHKSKQGKGGLYCPTKLEDGSWCKWRP